MMSAAVLTDGVSGSRTQTGPGLNRLPLPLGYHAELLLSLLQAPPIGFEPTISTVTGWRALHAAPRGRVVFLLSVARVRFEPGTARRVVASPGLNRSGLPVAYRAVSVILGGLEPPIVSL